MDCWATPGSFSKPTCAQLGQPSTCTVANDAASYNLADFMFGLPSQIQLANWLVGNYRQRHYFLYFQDDFRVNSKLTLNLGLRWEFATPRWERDNVLSNYDPIHQQDDRRHVRRPLQSDAGRSRLPRLGAAPRHGVQHQSQDRLPRRLRHQLRPPQPPGQRRRTGHQRTAGATWPPSTSRFPPAARCPPSFLTTQNAFPPGLASPANFNAVNANVAYIPRDTRWPYVQTWFASLQRELMKTWVRGTRLHRQPQPARADPQRLQRGPPQRAGRTLGIQPRRPNQSFGAITWVDPAGQSAYNGALRARGAPLRLRPLFPEFVHLVQGPGQHRAGAGEQRHRYRRTSATCRNERGPSSYDVKFLNVTSVVYRVPFGKGRKFGANWNGVLDAIAGGWEINTINTANSGLPLTVTYTPSAAYDATGRLAEYRGVASQRPNLVGRSHASRAARP